MQTISMLTNDNKQQALLAKTGIFKAGYPSLRALREDRDYVLMLHKECNRINSEDYVNLKRLAGGRAS